MRITVNFNQFDSLELKRIEEYIQNKFDEFIKVENMDNKKEVLENIKDNEINISSPENDNLNMDLQLLASKELCNQDVKNNCKEVLKETEDYILFKRNNMYILRYFDECRTHEKYNRNKNITQSRITKYYDNIKHLLE